MPPQGHGIALNQLEQGGPNRVGPRLPGSAAEAGDLNSAAGKCAQAKVCRNRNSLSVTEARGCEPWAASAACQMLQRTPFACVEAGTGGNGRKFFRPGKLGEGFGDFSEATHFGARGIEVSSSGRKPLPAGSEHRAAKMRARRVGGREREHVIGKLREMVQCWIHG